MALRTHETHDYWEDRGLMLLWFAVLAGPTASVVDIGAGYALVKWTCATGHKEVLTAISAAALALTMAGAWVAWTFRERLRDANDQGGRVVDRSYFAAVVAIGLNLLNALLILLTTFPHFVLSPCE
jgi:hypothetical protein